MPIMNRVKTHRVFVVFMLFFLIYAAIQIQAPPNPGDDIEIITLGRSQSVTKIFTSVTPVNEGHFYRPVIRLTAKLLFSIFPLGALPINGLIISLTLLLFIGIYRICLILDLPPPATLIVLFGVLGSPFTFSALTWFADFGTLLIYLSFVALVLTALQKPNYTFPVGVLLSVLVVFCKEHGLVLIGLCFFLMAYQKSYLKASVFPLIVLGYLALRYAVLGAPVSDVAFVRDSGFFFQTLSADTLNEKFAHFPYPMYLYNCIAAFLDMLFNQPHFGKLGFSPFPTVKVFRFMGYTSATLIMLWSYRYLGLGKWSGLVLGAWSCLVMNSILSFSAVEYKVLAIGGLVYPLLVGLALSEIIKRASGAKRIFITAGLACFFMMQTGLFFVKHLAIQERHKAEYIENRLFLKPIATFPQYKDTFLHFKSI